MQANLNTLIQAIHDSPTRAVIVTAGAGSQALADLLAVGGASRTLIEGVIPYSTAAFDEFLTRTPDQYTAPATARLLAGRALTRGRWLEGTDRPIVGVSCTASIASDRPKRGEHRAYVAVWQPEQLVEYDLHLAKGARDRMGEETVVSHLLLNALAAACGRAEALDLALGPGDALQTQQVDFAPLAEQLQRGEIDHFGLTADGLIASTRPPIILSGSFNPLHEGHLGMAAAASQLLGHPTTFELSAVNVDKPPLPAPTVLARMAQFAGRFGVFASTAPTYVQKARLYPGVTFVVGYDTAVRIFDPRYYGGDAAAMQAALDELREYGCRFLVAGRTDAGGIFRSLAEIPIPAPYRDMFQPIPPELFRSDLSSSQLRATGARGSR
jgi:hypothetical protein